MEPNSGTVATLDQPITIKGITSAKKSIGPKKKRSKKKAFILIGIILFVISVALFLYFGVLSQGTASEGIVIQEEQVSKGDVSTTIKGTGTLSSASTIDMQIPSGIDIEEVYVSVGDEVMEGDALASVNTLSLNASLYASKERLDELEDEIYNASSETSSYYKLLKEQSDMQEMYSILQKIAETNTITASSSGVINSVGVYGKTASGSTSTPSDSSSSSSSTLPANHSSQGKDATTLTASYTKSESMASTSRVSTEIDVVDLMDEEISPALGSQPMKSISTSQYSGTISWNPSHAAFQADTSYTAEIVLAASDGLTFSSSPTISSKGTESISWAVQNNGTELKIKAVFAALPAVDDPEDPKQNPQNPQGPDDAQDPASSSLPSSNSLSSGSVSSASISSDTNAANDAGAGSDNANLITAFGIASGDEATIIVSVDEMDVLSVSTGQSASVILDAIEGETFEGEISKVNKVGTSSGGAAKYSVEITLPKTSLMLEGMNASTSIIISESTDTLTISSAALQQVGNSSYVYTEKDESTGELSGQVEVEIGESNGSLVEILSGLSEGDTVYYRVATSNSNNMSIMFGDGGMGAGNMDMDTMPDRIGMGGNMSDMSGMRGGSQ